MLLSWKLIALGVILVTVYFSLKEKKEVRRKRIYVVY